MTAAAAVAEPLLSCGNCCRPMQRLDLEGHYGSRVAIDLCRDCDLVWFDDTEIARLTGSAVLALIGAMAEAYALPHELLRPGCACPRCSGPLRLVHDATRWGKMVELQCLRRDGSYQSFAQFLEGKGLLRPMARADRARLLLEKGRIDCINCGGEIGVDDALCPFCRSVPSLLDVARLARALDPQQLLASQPVHATPAAQSALQCAACGAALPIGQTISCPQCRATLAIDNLEAAYESVKSIAAALREAEAHPSPAVVKRRIEAITADEERHAAWLYDMNRGGRSELSAGGRPLRSWPGFSGAPHERWRWILLTIVLVLCLFAGLSTHWRH